MQSATLSMTLADYEALKAKVTAAEAKATSLRAELAAARAVDPTGTITAVTTFAREALHLARFAVANCPPEMIKGWPYETLRRICDTIQVLPDYDENDRSMALDLYDFANDCEEHAIRRRKVAEANAPLAALRDLAGAVEVSVTTAAIGDE